MSRRLGIVLADQVLSSASNFLVVIAVARVAGVDAFGAFMLAFLVYQLMLGVLRAGAGDVLLIRSADREAPRESDPGHALGFVLATAVPAAMLTGLSGALIGGQMRAPLIAIAIVLTPSLLQDCYRYVFFAASRPRAAVLIDSTWLAAQLGGFGLAAAGVLPGTTTSLVLIWGTGATLSCACGALFSRTLPSLDVLAWVRAARHRVGGLVADFMLLTGVTYLGFALLPLVSSLSTIAALRGAQFLFNPLLAVFTSVRVVALPILAERLREGGASYRGTALRMGAALSVLTITYSAVVLLLPESVGVQILGESWTAVQSILVPTALAALAGAVSYPAAEALRALGGARRLLATRAVGATAAVGAMLAGAAAGGASGGAIGAAIARWGAAVGWQISLRAALADRLPGSPPRTEVDAKQLL
jgi:O-antigen/teichoic acid export membrane protein